MNQKNIRKLLEMNCMILAQAQMMQDELIEILRGDDTITNVYHTDVSSLMKKIREKAA